MQKELGFIFVIRKLFVLLQRYDGCIASYIACCQGPGVLASGADGFACHHALGRYVDAVENQ